MKLKKIENIISYNAESNDLYFLDIIGQIRKIDLVYQKNIVIKEHVESFFTYGEYIYFQHVNGGNLFMINKFSYEVVQEIKGRFYLESRIINKDYFLLSAKNSDKSKSIYMVLGNTISKTNIKIFPNLLCVAKKYVSIYYNGIAIFNFDNEIIWEYPYNKLIESEKAFLHGEILEQSGKLFFSVAGDKLGDLFCLDVNSGKILHKFEGLVYTIFKDEEFIYTTRYENVLCKINPLTFEVEDWDVNELVKLNGFLSIQDHRCVAYNGKFYFTQTIGDTIAKLGILDMHKKELVYKYDFEPKNGGIGSIQVKENRIFIHTQDNTLHIFEEE